MGPAYKGTLAAASRGCSITTCTAALGEAADGGRCSGGRCSIPSAVSPPLPINVGAINGCSGCIDAWQHQPAVSYNYQPTSEMVPQLPSLLARHSKTKRPSVLAGNRPIFIILYYYTTSTLAALKGWEAGVLSHPGFTFVCSPKVVRPPGVWLMRPR